MIHARLGIGLSFWAGINELDGLHSQAYFKKIIFFMEKGKNLKIFL
jgi:hypothetical protein